MDLLNSESSWEQIRIFSPLQQKKKSINKYFSYYLKQRFELIGEIISPILPPFPLFTFPQDWNLCARASLWMHFFEKIRTFESQKGVIKLSGGKYYYSLKNYKKHYNSEIGHNFVVFINNHLLDKLTYEKINSYFHL